MQSHIFETFLMISYVQLHFANEQIDALSATEKVTWSVPSHVTLNYTPPEETQVSTNDGL